MPFAEKNVFRKMNGLTVRLFPLCKVRIPIFGRIRTQPPAAPGDLTVPMRGMGITLSPENFPAAVRRPKAVSIGMKFLLMGLLVPGLLSAAHGEETRGLETFFRGEHTEMRRFGKPLGFRECLADQLYNHKAMKAEDVLLLCFQGAYGLDGGPGEKARFEEKFASLPPRPQEPLFELVSPDVMRVNPGAWKAKKLPSEWLFNLSRLSRTRFSDADAMFRSYLDQAENVLKGDLRRRFTRLRESSPAPQYAEAYRRKEDPDCWLVSTRFLFTLPVLVRASSLPETGTVRVIAIDGRASSGKTTLARQLAEIMEAGIIHMDDFFLPAKLRTPERYKEAGGNVHYERFIEEVLPHLKKPGKFTYRTFDCSTMGYGKHAEVKDSLWRIVEGAYSLHPEFGNYADLKVFYDISPEEQERRIIRRNGRERYRVFKNRWIPLEENYIRSCSVMNRADLVIGRGRREQ